MIKQTCLIAYILLISSSPKGLVRRRFATQLNSISLCFNT